MKTAVEWLISQLNKEGFAQVVTDEEIAQALAMEKEQIGDAYDCGWYDGSQENPENRVYKDYYEETFKLKKAEQYSKEECLNMIAKYIEDNLDPSTHGNIENINEWYIKNNNK
jgi:hypothetical protein